MRIEATTAFVSDIKRLGKKHHDVEPLRPPIKTLLAGDKRLLASKYHDHALRGKWKGYRELHVDKDWLLVYRMEDGRLTLVLIRTGTHDVLFGSKESAKRIRGYAKMPRIRIIGH